MKSVLAGLAAVALLPLVAVPARAAEEPRQVAKVPSSSPTPPSYASNRVMVQWADGTSRSERRAAWAKADITSADTLAPRVQSLYLAEGQKPVDAVRALRANPDVVSADRVLYFKPNATVLPGPNDHWYQEQDVQDPGQPAYTRPGQMWGLYNYGQSIIGGSGFVESGVDIDAVGAWEKTTGASSSVVAILDTGIALTHPDLNDRLWTDPNDPSIHGRDFVGNDASKPTTDPLKPDNDPSDDEIQGGHGVHVAGTAAAEGNNSIGVTGVAQRSTILPVRVCGVDRDDTSSNYNQVICPLDSIVAGIDWATAPERGAKIVNLSLGSFQDKSLPPTPLADVMARHPEALFVTSAGNDAWNIDSTDPYVPGTQNNDPQFWTEFPCAFNPAVDANPPVQGAIDNVLCVAAHDFQDTRPSFSNYGATSVDLAAPGVSILSTYNHFQPFYDIASDAFPNYSSQGAWSLSPANAWFFSQNIPVAERNSITPSRAKGTFIATTPPLLSDADVVTYDGINPTKCMVLLQGYPELADGDEFKVEALITDKSATVKDVKTWTYTNATLPPNTYHTRQDIRGIFEITEPERFVQARLTYTRAKAAGQGDPYPYGIALESVIVECVEPPSSLAAGNGIYAFSEGTSMATPHVSGTAALMQAWKPDATVLQIKQALMASVTHMPQMEEESVTEGRLNANAALEKLKPGPTPPPPPPPPPPTPTPTPPPPPAPTAPAAVTNAKVKKLKKGKSARISWAASSGATSYKVRFAQRGKKFNAWRSTGSLSMTLNKLSPKRVYTVQIVAANAAGDSAARTVTIKKGRK